MKKFYFIISLFVLVTVLFQQNVSAQKNEWVNQVIGINGGRFESVPPYVDYATVQSYIPSTGVVTVFDTIHTQSVQDVVISGNKAYVAAQDSIVVYNIDTYQRLAAVSDSGLSRIFLFEGNLIVSKQYPITRFFVEVLDADDLSLIARIDGISGECSGISSTPTAVFVGVNGGWMGTTGKIAIINPLNWTLYNEVDLGSDAIGIDDLFTYDTYIYTVNKTPYGAADTGSISRFNYMNGQSFTKVLGVAVGDGYGLVDSTLYLKMNEGMGSFKLMSMEIGDTVIVPDPGSSSNVTIHAAAIDYVNNEAYLNIGNRSSFGIGVVTTLAGDSVTSFSTGVNAEALAIDFRTPTAVQNISEENVITISPNPASSYTVVKYPAGVSNMTVYDLTGRTMISIPADINGGTERISTGNYPAGIYLISLQTTSGTKALKFIKK